MTAPRWAADLVTLYEGGAVNQFILHGNVDDRMVLPVREQAACSATSSSHFLRDVLMPRFDVVLSYDLGNGVRIEKGGEVFAKWPQLQGEATRLPKAPRRGRRVPDALLPLHRQPRPHRPAARLQVGCIITRAHLVAPALPGRSSYDLNALALLDARLVERRAARRAHARHVPRHREPQRPAPAAREQHAGRPGEGARCRRRTI